MFYLSDRIDFTKPILSGTIIELLGKVVHIGITSMKVPVEIYIEQIFSEKRKLAITSTFSFVAINENKKPVKIL